MKLWNHYEAAKEWHRWVPHSSTEGELFKVIRRRHQEQYQHQRCPYPDCDIHPEPLVSLASDNPK